MTNTATRHPIVMVNRGRWVPLRLSGDQLVQEIVNLWANTLVSTWRAENSGLRLFVPTYLIPYLRSAAVVTV